MIAIEFASDDDACLVLKALPAEAQGEAYFRPAIAAVPASEDDPGQDAAPPLLYVAPEHEAAARALAEDLPVARKATLIAYAADLRWQREQAGTLWNGWPLHTDDRSQGKILSELQAIAQAVRIDGDGWKFADGQFRPVSNAEFPALAIAAREHVRNLFVIEAGLLVAIEAGTITSVAAIDAAFAA